MSVSFVEVGSGQYGKAYLNTASGDVVKCFTGDKAETNREQEATANAKVLQILCPVIVDSHTAIHTNPPELGQAISVCENFVVTRGGRSVSDAGAVCSPSESALPAVTAMKNSIRSWIGEQVGPGFAKNLLTSLYKVVNGLKAGNAYHMDIKPSNVFLAQGSDEGTVSVRVGDFGLLKTGDDDRDGYAGTYFYMGVVTEKLTQRVVTPSGIAASVPEPPGVSIPFDKGPYYVWVINDLWMRTVYSIAMTLLEIRERCQAVLPSESVSYLSAQIDYLRVRLSEPDNAAPLAESHSSSVPGEGLVGGLVTTRLFEKPENWPTTTRVEVASMEDLLRTRSGNEEVKSTGTGTGGEAPRTRRVATAAGLTVTLASAVVAGFLQGRCSYSGSG
jgi:hypothetical protein